MIRGIGPTLSLEILNRANISPDKRTDKLTEDDVAALRAIIDEGYRVEGDLRREISMNINRLMEMGCYRGWRHRRGLPSRGQRTHTNARTRKGPKRAMGRGGMSR
jgi:small subunit ribosomal protein S13